MVINTGDELCYLFLTTFTETNCYKARRKCWINLSPVSKPPDKRQIPSVYTWSLYVNMYWTLSSKWGGNDVYFYPSGVLSFWQTHYWLYFCIDVCRPHQRRWENMLLVYLDLKYSLILKQVNKSGPSEGIQNVRMIIVYSIVSKL